SPGRKSAKRISMIAETPGDHFAAPAVAALEMILPRELQRSLGGFRTAAREPDPVERAGAQIGDHRRKFFGSVACEDSCVDELEPGRLLRDGVDHNAIAMPQTRYGRTSARVDVAPPVGVDQIDAFATNRDRRARGR